MLVKKVTNISAVTIPVSTPAGTVYLSPRSSIENVDVLNEGELRYTAKLTHDLTEVGESKASNHQRIRING